MFGQAVGACKVNDKQGAEHSHVNECKEGKLQDGRHACNFLRETNFGVIMLTTSEKCWYRWPS